MLAFVVFHNKGYLRVISVHGQRKPNPGPPRITAKKTESMPTGGFQFEKMVANIYNVRFILGSWHGVKLHFSSRFENHRLGPFIGHIERP